MSDKHMTSTDRYNKLRARCASIAQQWDPTRAETWLAEAEPLIHTTAKAILQLESFPTSFTTEPAFTFTRDSAPYDVNAPKSTGPDKSPAPAYLELDSDTAGPQVAGPLTDLTVLDAARAIRRRDVSPVELLSAYVERIEATEDDVQAWDTLVAEQALAQARQAEKDLSRGKNLGPLHGIPFGIKDNIFTEGIPTAGGSRLYEGHIPTFDAKVVSRLKRAGAIVLGKTTTAEMALGDPPLTRNPWNRAHTPGGSSSGSAAAVAAGHVPFSLGTQTGGSLNRPAGYCGLVAVKPTYGRISRHGIFPVSWTMDHIGVMTRTVMDQLLILQSLWRRGERDGQSPIDLRSLRGIVIGRPDRYFFDALHPAQRQAYERALDTFESELGIIIKDVILPPSFEAAVAAHTIIMQCEAAAVHADAVRARAEFIGPLLRARLLCGHATSSVHYLRAQQIRNFYIDQLKSLFNTSIDILATPTSPSPAPRGIHSTGSSMFNTPFSVAGFPTVVFPTGMDAATRLPLSMQAIAPPLGENKLLHLASVYLQATGGF